jgi:hypothetical protein
MKPQPWCTFRPRVSFSEQVLTGNLSGTNVQSIYRFRDSMSSAFKEGSDTVMPSSPIRPAKVSPGGRGGEEKSWL